MNIQVAIACLLLTTGCAHDSRTRAIGQPCDEAVSYETQLGSLGLGDETRQAFRFVSFSGRHSNRAVTLVYVCENAVVTERSIFFRFPIESEALSEFDSQSERTTRELGPPCAELVDDPSTASSARRVSTWETESYVLSLALTRDPDTQKYTRLYLGEELREDTARCASSYRF
jgi:hypothetical protein